MNNHQDNIIITTTQPPAVKSYWTRCDDLLLERAFANVPEGTAGRWQLIAARVPGKTAEEVEARYAALEREVNEIESGRVSLPNYQDDIVKESTPAVRKKGMAWSQEEHRKFLEGLEIYGKGDWKSIARNLVKSRTAVQVASHAQKYFLRQASASQRKDKRKRSSIHDITTADTTMAVQQQPTPPPQPQPISYYDGLGGGIMGTPSPPPQPQPISVYDGQGEAGRMGTPSPRQPQPISVYDYQGWVRMETPCATTNGV